MEEEEGNQSTSEDTWSPSDDFERIEARKAREQHERELRHDPDYDAEAEEVII